MSNAPASVDAIDRRILELLHQDARRTFGDIGQRVGLSAPAVKRRVDRLENVGIILGYSTRVDYARLGESLEAFVELRFAGSTRVDDIEGIAVDVPEIKELFTVAGDPDALARIRVRDVQGLKAVVDQLRAGGKVTGTKTMMVLGSSIRDHASV
ncbi:MAG: Lrp/AsnC family transcriptional regulator [Acidimicrobiaceae bacterium]|nr:Lrp/AsnC family transcriptional regulator [Acidimicrobiaceae bacterium]